MNEINHFFKCPNASNKHKYLILHIHAVSFELLNVNAFRLCSLFGPLNVVRSSVTNESLAEKKPRFIKNYKPKKDFFKRNWKRTTNISIEEIETSCLILTI